MDIAIASRMALPSTPDLIRAGPQHEPLDALGPGVYVARGRPQSGVDNHRWSECEDREMVRERH